MILEIQIPSIDSSLVQYEIEDEVVEEVIQPSIFEVQEMLAKILCPAIVKELRREGCMIDTKMFEVYYRPSARCMKIQGGNPVRVVVGLHIASMPTDEYYRMLKRHLRLVPQAYRQTALVRSSLLVEFDKDFKRNVTKSLGVNVEDIPLTLKKSEYSVSEQCLVIAKHRETGIEVRVAMDIRDSIKCRETAVLKLSEEVLKRRMGK